MEDVHENGSNPAQKRVAIVSFVPEEMRLVRQACEDGRERGNADAGILGSSNEEFGHDAHKVGGGDQCRLRQDVGRVNLRAAGKVAVRDFCMRGDVDACAGWNQRVDVAPAGKVFFCEFFLRVIDRFERVARPDDVAVGRFEELDAVNARRVLFCGKNAEIDFARG